MNFRERIVATPCPTCSARNIPCRSGNRVHVSRVKQSLTDLIRTSDDLPATLAAARIKPAQLNRLMQADPSNLLTLAPEPAGVPA